ncbi:MAG: hypothetical protein M1813_006152 [Trichoglossum hirsutum]|nr:MAG: hypothetical protein M1813_006152 [Trichoglossum hirsutum]
MTKPFNRQDNRVAVNFGQEILGNNFSAGGNNVINIHTAPPSAARLGEERVWEDGKLSEFTEEQQKCLKSLFFGEMDVRRNDITHEAESTCAWLLEHRYFSTWLERGRGLLRIMGKPGAGKSTLMKYAVQNVNRLGFPGGLVLASFFFHGRGALIQKTPIDAPIALSEFQPIFRKKRETESHWIWHERELQDFLESTVARISREYSIRIFVDALDECGEKAARELLSYFSRLTSKFSADSYSLGICFSCRHYPIADLEHCLEICVEERNFWDIATYVRGELQRSFLQSDAEFLQREIVKKASGIFQWASLIVPLAISLHRKGHSMRAIHYRLREILSRLEVLGLGVETRW